MRVAIIGAGISGLGCAHILRDSHEVTVFEAEPRAGGHSDTAEVPGPAGGVPVDLGFIVYNERTYPRFTQLLRDLRVESSPSDMSFGAAIDAADLEYRLSSPASILAQPRSIVRGSYLRMLWEITRFNRAALRLAEAPGDEGRSLGAFVDELGLSKELRDWFLVPLGSAIWSANPDTFLEFPASTYARFMDNHGLLRIRDVPPWRTVTGGSRSYVQALTAPLGDRLRLGEAVRSVRRTGDGVEIATAAGPALYDRAILAVHSDQALAMLDEPTRAQREVLGAIAYRANAVTLHHDAQIMPRARRAWASWNVRVPERSEHAPTLSYWMNNLQPLATQTPWFVSLNSDHLIDPATVAARRSLSHPVFDLGARAAQRRQAEIQGAGGVFFAGAWWHNGFHEDGLRSAHEACAALLGAAPA
ncbi:unannotated protein [freshwater metagenome]|uniref:Unannotated protein n=1 Tax=freshwater metagenome TaxID=449393 RepID=A0A6J7EMP2_9ZZZZ|nr:FAD-dependent oxidoreductase [Actinomycetota bacterium]